MYIITLLDIFHLDEKSSSWVSFPHLYIYKGLTEVSYLCCKHLHIYIFTSNANLASAQTQKKGIIISLQIDS